MLLQVIDRLFELSNLTIVLLLHLVTSFIIAAFNLCHLLVEAFIKSLDLLLVLCLKALGRLSMSLSHIIQCLLHVTSQAISQIGDLFLVVLPEPVDLVAMLALHLRSIFAVLLLE